MSRRPRSGPSYRLHKQSGQAIVTLPDRLGNRRNVLLGPHGSPGSHAEYARAIAEWQASNGRLPPPNRHTDLTVNELAVRFLDHADQHYRHPDGQPTGEADGFKLSLRPLRELYGHTLAAEFGPLALKTVQDRMVVDDLSRKVVNQRVGRIKSVFKWAVTPCRFGGVRWWFGRPLAVAGRTCGRRVRKLYLRGRYFGCRPCHGLTYTSTQESDRRVYAALRARVNLVERGLGGSLGDVVLGLKAWARQQRKFDRICGGGRSGEPRASPSKS